MSVLRFIEGPEIPWYGRTSKGGKPGRERGAHQGEDSHAPHWLTFDRNHKCEESNLITGKFGSA